MKKIIFLFFVSTLFHLLFAEKQKISIPEKYSIVDLARGDLDNDSIEELVVVYNNEREPETEIGFPRELIIYKFINNKWIDWKKSKEVLYHSQNGGMMGDPFGDIEIKNGILQIDQNGGSSWRWGITDKYRFQNGDFYLIGYTSIFGKICEYWEKIDFNLSTGKLIFKKEHETCGTGGANIYKKEEETLFKKGLKITLQKRQAKKIKITIPNGQNIYIANGKE